MPDASRERLEKTWPQVFRTEVLKMIPEAAFAILYSATMGRPNFSVVILVALSILKEMLDLTDEALMDSFRFDLRFHHALGLTLEETDLSIRTLYNFRERVVGTPAVVETFNHVAGQIIEKLGLKTGKQRIDSSHICSNMATLTRLGLFVRTIEGFMTELGEVSPERCEGLPKPFKDRYGDRPGHFADARSSQCRRRLDMVAKDLWKLVNRFRGDEVVTQLRSYKLLERLLKEQCNVGFGDEGEPGGEETVTVKPGKEVAGDSLQNPSDPDATYDGHKGQGYQVQIVETCDKDNPIQVITHMVVEQAHVSDHGATIPAIDALEARDHTPEKLFGDTAYSSGQNLVEAAERGVELMAPTPGKIDPDGINLGHFELDLATLTVVACPEGKHPVVDELDKDGKTHHLRFDREDCKTCPAVLDCPAGKQNGRLDVHPHDVALAYSRVREESEGFKTEYKIRGGIESTNAECKKAHSMGKAWCRGLPKMTFATVMKLTACNVKRFMRHQCAQFLEKEVKMVPIAA